MDNKMTYGELSKLEKIEAVDVTVTLQFLVPRVHKAEAIDQIAYWLVNLFPEDAHRLPKKAHRTRHVGNAAVLYKLTPQESGTPDYEDLVVFLKRYFEAEERRGK